MEIFLLRIGELPGKKEENTVGTLKQNKRQSLVALPLTEE